ncbi:hypothetical protein QYF36_027098 [Acer negundo]|nr:hypothetical protein QYF36_027098 [Acer negundo]
MPSQPSLNTSGELLHPPTNHGISKNVADVQSLNGSIKADMHATPCFLFSKALSSLPNDAIKDVNGVFTKPFANTLKSSLAASIPSSKTENNNFKRHGRSKSRMVYRPISKTTYVIPLKNLFDTLNDISKPSLHKDAHEVSNDDKPVEEVQVDSSAIGNVSSGSKKISLKVYNILSSPEIVAFSPSELEVVKVGSSNSNLVRTMDATKASNMISFNMNDDASTRQHTGPIILHNSTRILNSNTGLMELDLQD